MSGDTIIDLTQSIRWKLKGLGGGCSIIQCVRASNRLYMGSGASDHLNLIDKVFNRPHLISRAFDRPYLVSGASHHQHLISRASDRCHLIILVLYHPFLNRCIWVLAAFGLLNPQESGGLHLGLGLGSFLVKLIQSSRTQPRANSSDVDSEF